MEIQLLSVAAVDNAGRHMFFKRCPIDHYDKITTPGDAVMIGTLNDAEDLINRYRKELTNEYPVNYITYTVKSNYPELDFYDQSGKWVASYPVH